MYLKTKNIFKVIHWTIIKKTPCIPTCYTSLPRLASDSPRHRVQKYNKGRAIIITESNLKKNLILGLIDFFFLLLRSFNTCL